VEGKSERPSPQRRRVLVADNHDDFAQIVGQLIGMDETLEFVGYVTSGAAALERARAGAADILLLDLNLGDCHGFEVLKQLQSFAAGIKVIVHSGYGAPEIAAQAKRLGASAFVVKDGDLESLMGTLRSV
jgi:DNA-binding NarL/FixJ family response regulator